MARLDDQELKRVRDLVRVSQGYVDDKYTKARRPDIMRRWFAGDHYGRGMPLAWVPQKDRVIVNITQANIYGKVSRLARSNPSLRVEGRAGQDQQQCEMEQRYLEHTWSEIKGLQEARRALFNVKIVGTGCLATGWLARQRAEASATQVGEETGPEFVEDRAMVRSLAPENLIYDPDAAEKIQRGWWFGETVVVPLSRLKKMPRYKAVAQRLEGRTPLPAAWAGGLRGEWSEDLRGVTIQILYLRDPLLRVELCDELQDEALYVGDTPHVDYPLDDEEKPYFPYVLARNIPDFNGRRGTSTHFGIGDVEINESAQIEIDVARSFMQMHRRMGVPIYLTWEGALDTKAKEALRSGKYNALVEIPRGQIQDKLTDTLVDLKRSPVAPETYTTKEDARRDMNELTRMSSWERAGEGPQAKWATTAVMMQAGAEEGKALEGEEFEEFVAETVAQISYVAHHWGTAQVPVTPEGGEAVPVTGVGVAGRYAHTIEPASMEPPNTELDERKWFARLQALLPFLQMGVNPRPLLEQWLRSFDAPNVEEILANVGQPMMAMPGQMPPVPRGPSPGTGQLPPEVETLLAGAQA